MSPNSTSVSGKINIDVHYYEDGNVRLAASKDVTVSSSSSSASDVVRAIAQSEKKYQEDLNRSFTTLSEGAFKGLRRQLPVTRQKVEWEKIGGYRVRKPEYNSPQDDMFTDLHTQQIGQDIGAGKK